MAPQVIEPRKTLFGLTMGTLVGIFISSVPTLVGASFLIGQYSTQQNTQKEQITQIKEQMTMNLTSLRQDLFSQVSSLKAEMVLQLATIQGSNEKQFNIVREDIANIPGMKERVTQMDKRLDATDNRVDAQSRRLDAVSAIGVQNQTDIAAILRVLQAMKR